MYANFRSIYQKVCKISFNEILERCYEEVHFLVNLSAENLQLNAFTGIFQLLYYGMIYWRSKGQFSSRAILMSS